MNTIHLHIDGMDCGGCANAVENALHAVPGVVSARADLSSKAAHVEAAVNVNESDLVTAVEKAGYEARIQG